MRGKQAPKRQLKGDPKFHDTQIAKFINYVMERGKKSTATRIVYTALEKAGEESKKPPLEVFTLALKNTAPLLEVRSRRVGGANYQIPFPVRPERRLFLAANWIIDAANGRKGKPMAEKLAQEFLDAAKGEGAAIKKRADVHRMAEANRAFAHFAKY